MVITLIIIAILLLIFLWRFWTAVFLQLRTIKTIKNGLGDAMQSYCILGLVNDIKELQDKLFKLYDNLLDVNKTVKAAVSFKKISLKCFLTDEEIKFLEEYFF